MALKVTLKRVGSKFKLMVGGVVKGVFGSIGAAQAFLKKEFGKAFVPAPKGAKNPRGKKLKLDSAAAARILNMLGIARGEDFHTLSSSKVDQLLAEAKGYGYQKPKSASGSKGRYFHAHLQRLAARKNPKFDFTMGGTHPARGKDYVGSASGWVSIWKGSPVDAKALANHLTRSHKISAKTAKAGKLTSVKIHLKDASAAKRVVQDFKSELSAQGRKNPNTIGPKLPASRHAYYTSKLVKNGVPVRFLYKGQALNIVTGQLASKGSNVMYHPVYWSFDRATANELAKELGVTAVFDKESNPSCGVGRKKNVAMGKTIGKGKHRKFFPFRSSPDYDPTQLHDAEGKRARALRRKKSKAKPKARKRATKAPVRRGSKRSSMTRYRATQNPSFGYPGFGHPTTGRKFRETGMFAESRKRRLQAFNADKSRQAGMKLGLQDRKELTRIKSNAALEAIAEAKGYNLDSFRDGYDRAFDGYYPIDPRVKVGKLPNPKGKRKIPAAFKAAAERARSMTPAQRAAWAKKMAAAKAAKRRGR